MSATGSLTEVRLARSATTAASNPVMLDTHGVAERRRAVVTVVLRGDQVRVRPMVVVPSRSSRTSRSSAMHEGPGGVVLVGGEGTEPTMLKDIIVIIARALRSKTRSTILAWACREERC